MIYNSLLKSQSNVCLPELCSSNERQVYYTYTLRCNKRDELMAWLLDHNIECKIQHPILMSDQAPFADCIKETTNASNIIKSIISIPIHEASSE